MNTKELSKKAGFVLLVGVITALIVYTGGMLLINVGSADEPSNDSYEQLEVLHQQDLENELKIKALKEDVLSLERELLQKQRELAEARDFRKWNYEQRNQIINQELDNETSPAEVSSFEPVCRKTSVGEDSHQHEKINHILEVSNNDKDFLFTLEAENGQFDPFAVNWNTNGSFDKGLCQLNSNYHLDYINGTDFPDWRKQVYYCYDIYLDAKQKNRLSTTFYGYNVRHQRANGKYLCN